RDTRFGPWRHRPRSRPARHGRQSVTLQVPRWSGRLPDLSLHKGPRQDHRNRKGIQPSFGAINLEDISQPKCFYILDKLRSEAEIPVWHDDQQGTATVIL